MNYYELFYDGRYDELVAATFPLLDTDKDAERAFLRLFLTKHSMVLLDYDKTIAMLMKHAEQGNRYAQYAYARWQCLDCSGENSLWISYRNMKAAADQGLPDAIAGLAVTYEYGDIGQVDWEKADEMLQRAANEGSELAYVYKFKEYCFGKCYRDAQPEKAVELADKLLAESEQQGIEPNGLWYYYRAAGNEPRLGRTHVIDDYKRALELGVISAYFDLAVAYGYGDEITKLTETPEFNEYILQGEVHRSADAVYMDAVREMHRYDILEQEYRERGIEADKIPYNVLDASHEYIHSRMTHAAMLADISAWEQLGDMYADGTYGFERDNEKAFTCYSNGVIHNSPTCAEKLWKMMHKHIIDRDLDYQDGIAIMGARWGSKFLLAETVIAAQEGRLTEYADEIAKYYEPIFDAPEFTLEDDEDWQTTIDDMLRDDDYDYPDDSLSDNDSKWDAWA